MQHHHLVRCEENPILQLNKIDLREVRRTAGEYRPAFPIQRLVLVTDPDVLAEALRAVDLVVTDAQVVSRDPDHGAFGSEGIVLKGSLCELIAFIGRQVLQFVLDSGKEGLCMAFAVREGSLVFYILGHIFAHSLDARQGRGRVSSKVLGTLPR